MRNIDLRYINLSPWDIPKPYHDPEVRAILEEILKTPTGESFQVVDLEPERHRIVQWRLQYQIRRHELGARVQSRGRVLIIRCGANAT